MPGSFEAPSPLARGTRPRRYGPAVAAVALALVLRRLPAGAGADTPPGVLFHCAVVVGAWLGGLGPGLLATALSGGLIASGSVEPIGSPRIAHPGLGLRLGEFLAEGSLVSLLMARLRDSRRRAELGAEEACRRREALRRSEERARLLIEDVRDYAIFRLDAGGRIASWNAGAEAVTGYAAGAILGRHVSALDTPEAVARGESRRDLREAEATGRFQGEGWRVRQDGSRFWAHLSITALPTEAGSARGFSVVAHDISRRRADEEALRRDRDELEGRVLERTAELAAANRALREEMDQHRRTEQDLRACRWRYGVLADTVPQIVWSAGPDGRPGDFNRLWFAYTGLTPREGLGPEGWLRAVHPDDVPYCTRRLAEAIGAGAPYELEFRLRRAADGAYRWHLGRAVPLRDDQGRVVQWLGTCTDIDDHKRDAEDPRRSRAELEDRVRRRMADLEDVNAALRGRASILQSILDAMADGVLVADRDGRFLAFNPAAERIFGHGATAGSAAEWPGRCGLYRPDRVTPLPVEEMPLIRAARGESLGDQEIFVRHARAPEGLWILARGRPLPGEDGTPAGGVVVCHDVTGRKRAEEALRASEAKFRLLLESAPEAILVADRRGRIVLANTRAAAIFGYDRPGLIGRAIEDLLPESPDAEPPARPMATGRPLLGRRRDGAVFPVEVRLGLLETAGEALVTCIVRDAAAREPAEEDRVVGLGGRVRVESHPGVGSPCSFTVPAPPEVLP